MFGYIKPCKGQIGEENFEIFNAYYCGLCKAIGKNCSHIARLGLSYDVTFLSMLLSSVLDDTYNECEKNCIVHPIKKKKCVLNDKAVDYSAYMSVMLSYLKLADDWNDEKSVKALFGMLLFKLGIHRARRHYPNEYIYIKNQIDRLSELEKAKSGDIDECANCFAEILKKLFAPDFIDDENMRRALGWFGYNIGRWIFVIDALNDLEKDFKEKAYNPFLCDFDGDNIIEYTRLKAKELETTLTLTLENAASALDLIKLYKNSDVAYGIVYRSLKIRQTQILNKYIGENNGSI